MNFILIIFFAALGALSGSFTCVLAERINTGGSWLRGRSRCNTCDRMLGPLDLVPVFSWLFSKGKCRTCKASVPLRYALIETLFSIVFALSYLKLGLSLPLFVFLLAVVILGALVLYDVQHTIVPSSLSTFLLVLSAFFLFVSSPSFHEFGMSLAIAGCIGLGFLLLYMFSDGRAMGLGDSPVALALSLLTAPAAIPGLLFSFWIGAVVGIVILVLKPKGHRMGIEVPFVPFLALGFLLAYFTGWNPLAIVL